MSSLFKKNLRSHLQTKNIKKLGTSIGTNALNGASNSVLWCWILNLSNHAIKLGIRRGLTTSESATLMWLPYVRYRSFCRGVNAPQQYRVRYCRMRHVLCTQRIRNTLYSMQVNVLPAVGFTEPLGVQLMKWTAQKLIHCAIKASPETTIFWQLPC